MGFILHALKLHSFQALQASNPLISQFLLNLMIRKVIVYSSLFPSHSRPTNGLFVAELVKALSSTIQVSVISPVIVPKSLKGSWKEPRKYYFSENVEVKAPLSFNFPNLLKSTDGYLMAACTRRAFKKSLDANTSLVHAHFAYPDAVAAWILASEWNLPLVVTVHGSDINILAEHPPRRRRILKMLKNADSIVCVSKDLVNKVVKLGVPGACVQHIPNGVDTVKFFPGNKESNRKRLGLGHMKKLLLTVGHIVPIKGYERLIKALSHMNPDIGLVLVGDGHERNKLERLVKSLGLEERVSFAGIVKHDDLTPYYQAADFLVISSYSEGWPTVIFEALACGVPVIANDVGGIPEVLKSPEHGLIMKDNDHQTIADSVSTAYQRNWNQHAAVSFAEKHSWDEIAKQYLKVYEHIISGK